MKYMGQFFPEVDESTFYAILRRLNKEGLTEVYYGQVSNGPEGNIIEFLTKEEKAYIKVLMTGKIYCL